MDGQGNSERTWKVREFEKNGYGRQSSENLFILFKRENGVHSHDSLSPSPSALSPSPSALGATLKGKNLLPWGANSFL